MPTKLLVVIPTRNRSALAATAVRSVLDQAHPHVSLWVSDNSTEPLEIERLRQFCATAGAAVRYLRPAEPLAMGKHWEWVLRQALEADQFSHCCVLTDRMAFLPDAIGSLVQLCDRLPQTLVSYPTNMIKDDRAPVALVQASWTGRVLRVERSDFVRHVLHVGWVEALPRLLNCVAPLAAFRLNLEHYGSICESGSPDIAFGFRQLALLKDFCWLDKPILVQYGRLQSNGLSLLRGEKLNAYATDFLAQLDQRGFNYAAPIPGLRTLYGAIYHEYSLVQAVQQEILPGVNDAAYLRLERKRIRKVTTEEHRTAVRDALRNFAADRRGRLVMAGTRLLVWRVARALRRPQLLVNRIRLKLLSRNVRRRRVTLHANFETALAAAFSKPLPRRRGPAKIERETRTTLVLDGITGQ